MPMVDPDEVFACVLVALGVFPFGLRALALVFRVCADALVLPTFTSLWNLATDAFGLAAGV
jgi:hypothetical protein